MVQVVLAKRFAVPCQITQVVSGSIGRLNRATEGVGLLCVWLQLHLCDQFQLNILLVLDVLLDYRERCAADRDYKIAVRPQGRKAGSALAELCAKDTRGATFYPLHEFVDSKLRINADKEVDVIWHYLQLDNLATELITNLRDEFLQSGVNPVSQNATPILGTPNDMVLADISDVVVCLSPVRFHRKDCTALGYL